MPPAAPPSRTARVLDLVGRTLAVSGALILAFVGHQLWGTGLQERRAQQELVEAFTTIVDPVSGTASTPTEGAAPAFDPAPGDPVARIRIPAIGVDKVVVWGTDLGDLRDGPGLYVGTPLPGQSGNSAIAGHRTTYGAPFARLDELEPGDLIEVDTAYGSARYRVTTTEIVTPDRVDVVDDKGDDRLTLTTCHPRFSDRERMIVSATLETPAAVAAPAPISSTRVVGSVATRALVEADPSSWPGTIGWGLATAAMVTAAAVLARRPRQLPARIAVRIAVAPPALVGLYLCFTNLERLLPLY